jgi:hypothetical protein
MRRNWSCVVTEWRIFQKSLRLNPLKKLPGNILIINDPKKREFLPLSAPPPAGFALYMVSAEFFGTGAFHSAMSKVVPRREVETLQVAGAGAVLNRVSQIVANNFDTGSRLRSFL